jgi:transcription elongation GreA/GreB family factor
VTKPHLLAHCIELVDASIADIKTQMTELVSEAENDSKSTAGDKHETARAMMQLAQEQLGKQLLDAEYKRNTLTRLDAHITHKLVAEGSIVKTSDNTLFIAAPMGKIQFEGKDIFVISAQSPLGKLLMGKSVGVSVSFNQRNIAILDLI